MRYNLFYGVQGVLGSNPITQILFPQRLKGILDENALFVLWSVGRICGGKLLENKAILTLKIGKALIGGNPLRSTTTTLHAYNIQPG